MLSVFRSIFNTAPVVSITPTFKADQYLKSITRDEPLPINAAPAFWSNGFDLKTGDRENTIVAKVSRILRVVPTDDRTFGSTSQDNQPGLIIVSDLTLQAAEYYIKSTTRNRSGEVIWWVLAPTAKTLKAWPDVAKCDVVLYNE